MSGVPSRSRMRPGSPRLKEYCRRAGSPDRAFGAATSRDAGADRLAQSRQSRPDHQQHPTHHRASASRPRRFGSFEQTAARRGVTAHTTQLRLEGLLPAVPGAGCPWEDCSNLDEVDEEVRKIPKKLAKAGFRAYGSRAGLRPV